MEDVCISKLGNAPANNKHSTTTTTETASSLLEKRKKLILELSMARFGRQLDAWLDKLPESGKTLKRPRGAVESDHYYNQNQDSAVGAEEESKEHQHGQHHTVTREVKKATTTKRVKHHGPEAPGGEGRKFACPFCQHNPAKYRTVKTCCGPGWDSVHRVKEHIYRRHSLKNTCPRCYEQFKTDEDLKSHQRAETPCRLRKDNVPEVITDEQDKKLHARAKAGLSEEDKWNDMYRIIFPGPAGSKIPSPYYDTSNPTPSPSPPSTANPSSRNNKTTPTQPPSATSFDISSFKDLLRRELPRYVEPIFRQELDKMMTSVQTQMNQKADQLFKDVVFKFSRTWVWPATTGTGIAGGPGTVEDATTTVVTPFSGPPSPGSDRYDNLDSPGHVGTADDHHRDGEEEEVPVGAGEVNNFPPAWLDAFVEGFDPNSLDMPFFKDGQVDLEACFEGVMNSSDSAYGTLPASEGQHGSYGLGGLGMGSGMAGMTGVMGMDAWMR
ncbi:hypothetical protein B0T20DRAFT_59705 [Sordaria brevicollis]|uniref:C2H2-type domain-containing protein n=1 Tax=Sordaria brevicollis TaxID=83679 RepID=A0AAE0U6M8_SORBR|nr:hypothetical protein B0T20DRAFT_59705 [Sordaria brevicollis]